MTVRVAIKEFGIIQKGLAGATVTFYEADANGESTGTQAVIYTAPTGSGQTSNPQVLNSDGMLGQDCYVSVPVAAAISGIADRVSRSVSKIVQNPMMYALPVTSAAVLSLNVDGAEIINATINNSVIGGSTPASGTFTNLTCSSFLETSDERLKTNVQPLHEAASKLLALKPVSYQRKSTKASPRTELGFVAQEIKEVLPEMVSEGADGYLSVHYLDLIALLVRGYQDMATHIVELNHRIKALEVE